VPKGSALTDKQALFCREYLKDMNASAAYRRAGYESENPDVQAAKLMQHPLVRHEIGRLRGEVFDAVEVEVQDVVRELAAIGFMPVEAITAAAGPSGKGPLSMSDKVRALELLGRHKAMFVDKLEANVNNQKVLILPPDVKPE